MEISACNIGDSDELLLAARRAWEVRDTDVPRSLELAQQVLAVAGSGPEFDEAQTLALLTQAAVACHAGRLDDALADAERARGLTRSGSPARERALSLLGRIHILRGNTAEGRCVIERQIALSRRLGNRVGIAFGLMRLGAAHLVDDEYDAAVDHLKEALEHAGGETTLRAGALVNLAEAERRRGRPDRAITHLQESLPLFEAAGNAHGTVSALSGMYNIRAQLGDAVGAVDLVLRALEVARRQAMHDAEVRLLSELARFYVEMGASQAARDAAFDAYEKSKKIDSAAGKGVALKSLAQTLADAGEFAEAEETLREGVRLFDEFGGKASAAAARRDLGRVLLEQGKVDEALAVTEAAWRRHRQLANPRGEAVDLVQLGRALLAAGRHADAIERLQQGLDLATGTDQFDVLPEFHRELARVHAARGEWQAAFDALSRSHEFDAELRTKRVADRMHNVHKLATVQAAQAEAATQHRLNEQLRLANDALRSTHEAMQEMLGTVAHQLRNPLTGVVGGASLTQHALASGDMADAEVHVRTVLEAADRMTTAISRLLEVNVLENGRQPLRDEMVDLVEIAQDARERFQDAARTKRLAVLLHAPAERACVRADRQVTAEIVDNLLSNAVKFSPPGLDIDVHIGASFLEVRDHGPGLSPADQERLFGKFVRLTPLPTGGESSSGLGLYIAKQLAGALGATIACESRVGVGSRFRVTFPEAPASQDHDATRTSP